MDRTPEDIIRTAQQAGEHQRVTRDSSIESNVAAIKKMLDQEKLGRKIIYMLSAITTDDLGMSQYALAKKLKVGQSTVRDWVKQGRAELKKQQN